MDNILLFITGVLSGIIAGFIFGRFYTKSNRSNDGSRESLLEERLSKADKSIEDFSLAYENLREELKNVQKEAQENSEKAKVKEVELKKTFEEKVKLDNNYKEISEKLDLIRIQKEKLSVENGELTEQLKSQEDESLRLDKEKKKLEEIQEINIEEKERLRVDRENLSNKFAEIKEQLRSQESQNKFLEQAKADLLTQFQALSGKMLDGSRNALLKTTKETVTEPFTKQVETLRKQVEELSKDSSEKLGVLAQTTSELKEKSEDVRGAAQQLTSALRSPNVKGRWGEVNLKRILEFVGLINYCDFDEQLYIQAEGVGILKPDCVITIPGSRKLIVDSKAPIESYLDAIQATDSNIQEKLLNEHLRKVRSHIDQLSKKDYANNLSEIGQVVDGVILYIPVEGALSMALERDPSLLEYAFEKNIILTFPTSLLAILKGLSMTIQQAEITKNINEIQKNAIELSKRFSNFIEKFNSIGSNITRLNKSFNDAVGSFERRLMPQGKRFAEMSGQNTELNLTEEVDIKVKELKNSDQNK